MSFAQREILSRNKSHSCRRSRCRRTDHKYSTNSANDIGVTQHFRQGSIAREEEKKRSTLHLLLPRKPLITLNWNGAFFF